MIGRVLLQGQDQNWTRSRFRKDVSLHTLRRGLFLGFRKWSIIGAEALGCVHSTGVRGVAFTASALICRQDRLRVRALAF